MAEIRTGGVRVFVRPDGLVHIIALERRKHTLEDARAVVAAIRELTAGARIQLLLDLTVTAGLESDARDYYNQEARSFASAIAVVTTSTIGRIIANFLITLNERVLDIRLFNDERAAVQWLRQAAVA